MPYNPGVYDRTGEIWGNAISNLGRDIGDTITQYKANKEQRATNEELLSAMLNARPDLAQKIGITQADLPNMSAAQLGSAAKAATVVHAMSLADEEAKQKREQAAYAMYHGAAQLGLEQLRFNAEREARQKNEAAIALFGQRTNPNMGPPMDPAAALAGAGFADPRAMQETAGAFAAMQKADPSAENMFAPEETALPSGAVVAWKKGSNSFQVTKKPNDALPVGQTLAIPKSDGTPSPYIVAGIGGGKNQVINTATRKPANLDELTKARMFGMLGDLSDADFAALTKSAATGETPAAQAGGQPAASPIVKPTMFRNKTTGAMEPWVKVDGQWQKVQ